MAKSFTGEKIFLSELAVRVFTVEEIDLYRISVEDKVEEGNQSKSYDTVVSLLGGTNVLFVVGDRKNLVIKFRIEPLWPPCKWRTALG